MFDVEVVGYRSESVGGSTAERPAPGESVGDGIENGRIGVLPPRFGEAVDVLQGCGEKRSSVAGNQQLFFVERLDFG